MRNNGLSVLFCGDDLHSWLEARKRQALDEIGAIPKFGFLNASVSDVVDHVASKYHVLALALADDEAAIEDAKETSVTRRDYGQLVNVAAHTLTIRIPFVGEARLWQLRPSFFTSNPPRGTVRSPQTGIGGDLLYVRTVLAGDKPDLKGDLQRELNSMNQYLQSQKGMVDNFNADLEKVLTGAVQKRRDSLKAQEGLIESLGLPLVKNTGMPDFKAVPLERAIRPLPPPPAEGYHAEPALTTQQFEDILSLVRHQGRTIEQTPDSFQALDEEALRDLVLAALNTHYKGQASGETFRKTGKTDVKIEAGDRSAVVAECKLWGGAVHFTKGLDQLLGYLTFRDSKAAVVVFNRNTADREKVLKEIDDAVRSHPGFKRTEREGEHGEMRYALTSAADASRDVHCHVFLFHIPTSAPKKGRTSQPRKLEKKT